MKIIGLTGNIASGKSLVADMFKKLGAVVIDADLVARNVVEPGKAAWEDIRDTFGSGVLSNDGTVDRKKLGEIVFNDEEKRKALNNITHPRIREEISGLIETSRKEGAAVVIIEAALIVENGGWLRDVIEKLIVVGTTRDLQIDRLVRRNNLSRDEALSRINSQMASSEKERHGDFIIDNSGSLEDTEQQVQTVWKEIKQNS